MLLSDLHPKIKELTGLLSRGVSPIYADGLIGSSVSLVFSTIEKDLPACLFILDDEEEAGYFYNDMCQVLGEESVLFFPALYRRGLKRSEADAANEVLRVNVLTTLMKGERARVVTYPDALLDRVVSHAQLSSQTLSLRKGERYDLEDLVAFLLDLGFTRTDYVYEVGQFAVRGCIVDIFSFSNEQPYRLDFFGDDIESIHLFNTQTQLSEESVENMVVVPEINDAKETELIPLTDFLPNDALIVVNDEQFVEEKAQLSIQKFKRVIIGSNGSRIPSMLSFLVSFNTSRQPLFHKNFDLMREEFMRLQSEGYKINILADNPQQLKRLKEIFTDESNSSVRFRGVNQVIHAGFIDHDTRQCFFTDHQIFDRYHKYNLRSDKIKQGKMTLTLKELQQLQLGDYVVHLDHGIGKFGGLVMVPEGDDMQEKIMITYRNGDTAYVSIHSLHKLAKYRGKEGEEPRLSSLGTGAWQRMKERVKAKVKDIARDLIRLYAVRQKSKGFAYSPDGYMQQELESSFIYEDTPDQLKATQSVKADMERDIPMDRLICGDVGFGKTEVAIRAAFKAATDGKQVAVLVPTTVLAYQHYKTFTERLHDLPVRVEYLSRAVTPKHTKEILEQLEQGKIDIIIGTHKLVGKQIRFKDLGLLIIDEEQKFGVAVKEKLRQMKANVDTLTLTATPIPRTLQFSLMGARDLSIIQTPPPNRYPIQTEVHTFSTDVIMKAINFEMSRNGQVFFVNNRVSNLGELEALIHKCVPDARVCIGHGQMNPTEMEKVIIDFMNYEYDVLLSTTIIENGIDIPNANTIIINSAQNYGLSDLHQMRGRVGRSHRKAFCYLLAPPLSALSDDARRRLRALETFSDLGMGLQIAMQDLDIRGAGNMLGAEQSGFIADLGYETYQKVLKEAMDELKRETREMKNDNLDVMAGNGDENAANENEYVVGDVIIESDLPVYFSEAFVPTSEERITLYRELDSLENDEQLENYRKRLIDRFGPLPPQAEELINIMPMKWCAMRLGIEKIVMKKGSVILYLPSDFNSLYYQSNTFYHIITYATNNPRQIRLREEQQKRSVVLKNVKSVIETLQILQLIIL